MQNPLPTFSQTRSLLNLRETQLLNSDAVGNQITLYGGAPSHGAGSFNSSGPNSGSDHGDGARHDNNDRGDSPRGNRISGNWRKKKTLRWWVQQRWLIWLSRRRHPTRGVLLCWPLGMLQSIYRPTTSRTSPDEVQHWRRSP
ncbi:hypothetical protein ZWY2020_056076 [Hordeum vulgare]|nr:hypothetical protein ZWY2020_056076 [Hordeum vulgare]